MSQNRGCGKPKCTYGMIRYVKKINMFQSLFLISVIDGAPVVFMNLLSK